MNAQAIAFIGGHWRVLRSKPVSASPVQGGPVADAAGSGTHGARANGADAAAGGALDRAGAGYGITRSRMSL